MLETLGQENRNENTVKIRRMESIDIIKVEYCFDKNDEKQVPLSDESTAKE